MASTQQVLLSPAELAYLHGSLSLSPPLRPDGRAPTQFRPLSAETGILPGTNGSARICFADGTEAIVGVKAEIEKTRARYGAGNTLLEAELIEAGGAGGGDDGAGGSGDEGKRGGAVQGEPGWVEIAVEIPGARDDDANTIYLAEMLSEALLADGEFVKRLWINRRFHWKLYLDVCVLACLVTTVATVYVYCFADGICYRSSSYHHRSHTPCPSSHSQPTLRSWQPAYLD